MGFKRWLWAVLLFLISIVPLPLPAQVATQPVTSPPGVTEEEVRKFLNEYAARYSKMDLDAFMSLFSKEAVENRMLPYADIRERYRRHFLNSRSLSYELGISSIQPYTRSAFVSGRYRILQTVKPKDMNHIFEGSIQWNLIREDDSLKIREMNYGRDPWK